MAWVMLPVAVLVFAVLRFLLWWIDHPRESR